MPASAEATASAVLGDDERARSAETTAVHTNEA
jgi:hypothetical protein